MTIADTRIQILNDLIDTDNKNKPSCLGENLADIVHVLEQEYRSIFCRNGIDAQNSGKIS